MLSIFDEGAFRPCPNPFNMAAHVLAAGAKTPDKDALVVVSDGGATRWSHAALRAAVLGTAQGLRTAGLEPGDIVLLRLGNTVDYPIAHLGALAAGLVSVPSSSALTERETAVLIETVSPAAILHAPGVACPAHARIVSLEQLRSFRDLPAAPFHMGDPERPGYIIFTSGTSGQPRAVLHAHRSIWARQMMFADWYGLRPEDRLMHAGAFNWTYTMGTGLMDPWTAGATALVPAPGTSSDHLGTLMARHDVSIFAAAPGVYRKILDHADKMDLPRLRHGLSAGEKLPAATAERWRAATGCPVYEAFGMSECSTFISQRPGMPPDPSRLGRPQTGRRVAIVADGTPVARGETGIIAVDRQDPGLMLGYLDAPAATSERMQGSWFLTGDQGIMHDDGTISYAGRSDDMMNAGGFRVSPIEVEAVLSAFPALTSVAVAAVRVKEDTEVIAAFYTAQVALDETALRTYVSQRLARYKQPRLYVRVPQLPLGSNGKILRRVLRETFEGNRTRP